MAYEDYLNQIVQNIGQMPRDRAIYDSIYGININGRGAPIALNTENHGFTFFTRPDLNLSYDNLQVDRVMSTLLLSDQASSLINGQNSIQRIIRSYLDPRAHRSPEAKVPCAAVDPLNPFMPLLSNNLVTLTGWPDFTLGTHTSQPGLYREAYSYVDDVPYSYDSYDLQATFRNVTGDPITWALLLWGWYQGLVYEGRLMPYPENVLYNVIDYNTRVYRLVTDVSRTYVTRIFACGASFPITAPIGRHADFTGDGSESPFQTVNDQITFTFRAMGFTYYDHILIYEFNTCVSDANPSMRDGVRDEGANSPMVKLQPWERNYFNYKSYPRINPASMELEWWVPRAFYESQKAGVIRYGDVNATSANG